MKQAIAMWSPSIGVEMCERRRRCASPLRWRHSTLATARKPPATVEELMRLFQRADEPGRD